MTTFLREAGVDVDPMRVALWGILTAISAFLIHSARLLHLDRTLARELTPGSAVEAAGAMANDMKGADHDPLDPIHLYYLVGILAHHGRDDAGRPWQSQALHERIVLGPVRARVPGRRTAAPDVGGRRRGRDGADRRFWWRQRGRHAERSPAAYLESAKRPATSCSSRRWRFRS